MPAECVKGSNGGDEQHRPPSDEQQFLGKSVAGRSGIDRHVLAQNAQIRKSRVLGYYSRSDALEAEQFDLQAVFAHDGFERQSQSLCGTLLTQLSPIPFSDV